MVETISYRKIGAADIQFGTGTFQVELIGGKVVTMEEVNLSHILGTLTNDSVVYVASGTLAEDNANFHYDAASTELFVPLLTGGDGASETLTLESTSHATKGLVRINPTGGSVVVGGTTASGLVDIKATGTTQVRIENVSGASTGDPYITFAIAGTDKFSVGVDDSDSDRFEFHSGGDLTGTPIMVLDGTNVGIGESSTLGKLHIKTADAGSITPNANGDEVVIEGSANSGLSILAGNTSTGNIYFADDGSPIAGRIFYDHNADTMNISLGGTTMWSMASDETLTLGSAGNAVLDASTGTLFLGTVTSNAQMEAGITIDQSTVTATNQYVACKSSDVAHGITSLAETDTFFSANMWNVTQGGIDLRGYSESTAGITCSGHATSEDTTSTGSSRAPTMTNANLKTGTTVTTLGTTANLFAILNSGTAKFLVKGDGDVYNAGGSTAMTTFDTHDDIKLIAAFRSLFAPADFKASLGEWVNEHLDILEAGGVIVRDANQGYFVSQSGFRGLVVDTIRQLAGRLDALEQQIL